MSKRSAADSLPTQKDFKDFCHLPNMLLSMFGWDFPSIPRSKSSLILRKSYFCLATVFHLYIFTFIARTTFGMMIMADFELSLFLRLLSGFFYAFFGTIKCIAFGWKMKRYRNIFEIFKELYPKSHKEKLIFRVRNYYWPKWMLFITYFYLGATAFIVISPFLESLILCIVNMFKMDDTKMVYHKLYEIEYSFDHRSLIRYIITYIFELLHAHFVIVFNMCADMWLICFTLQLCMHFDNLAWSLENYEPDERKFLKDQKFIGEVVKKHQTILNVCQDINKSFAFILLLVLMSIAATLCCAGVYCLTQDLGRELFEYVAFLPTAIGQYFLICYYGQQLILKSEKVAEAAYNNTWYNGSRSYKKSIYIILIRAQKAVEVNALGMQSICLEAFKIVMGATYRVFALLKETML